MDRKGQREGELVREGERERERNTEREGEKDRERVERYGRYRDIISEREETNIGREYDRKTKK